MSSSSSSSSYRINNKSNLENIISPKSFGAIADGKSHPVKEWLDSGKYRSLEHIQKDYPWISSIDDEIDWAAIQKALDVVWQNIRSTYIFDNPNGTQMTKSLRCHSSLFYLGDGYFVINKTLVLPPKIRFLGCGMQNTTIFYTGDGDKKWEYFNDLSRFGSDNKLFVVFLIKSQINPLNDHVTDGIYTDRIKPRNINPEDNTQEFVTFYSGDIGNFMVGSKIDSTCFIWCPTYASFDTVKIHDIHFCGYGELANKYVYGFIGARQDNMTFIKNLTLEDNVFELCRVGILFTNGEVNIVRNNRFWDCLHCVYIGTSYYSQVLNNVMKIDMTTYDNNDAGNVGIEAALIYGNINNNIIINYHYGIKFGGASVNCNNNSVAVPKRILANGFVIYVENYKHFSSNDVTNNARVNYGHIISTNTWNFMGGQRIFDYVPIYFDSSQNDETFRTLHGLAYGNGFAGEDDNVDQIYLSNVRPNGIKLLDYPK